MIKTPLQLLLIVVLSISTFVCDGQLRLPGLFSSHMVLQQQSTQSVWGWASPLEKISVKVSWDTVTSRIVTPNTGLWKTTIKTPAAGGPFTITVSNGHETVTLTDVMSGEVWLASGQSNMEWSMNASSDGKPLVDQINDPNIRLFHVPKSAADAPQVKGEGMWTSCGKETVGSFSAVAYFFGKKLNSELNIPIGLISASWGGTPAETWVPREVIESDEELKKAAKVQTDDKPWCPSNPGVTYNAMIHPLIGFQIAGAIWYQGETNVSAPYSYKHLMETLITDWRKEFDKEFPFFYVQIAPFSGYGDVEKGTLIREQQVKMLEIAKTGMVVISDHVDKVDDIHPKFKQPVGERLANLALTDTYGKKGISSQSPIYSEMKVEKGRIKLSFDFAEGGLVSKGGAPNEFVIAGPDKLFYPAVAKINGSSVIVSAKEVKQPVAVRFAWRNKSIGNLFSKEGLPVSSFRTDDWAIEVR
ncbi:MAG: sialate O-acetylesterase [Chryseolinea sp.]